MATWVNANKAALFPEIIKVFGRAGRGQGSGQQAGATTPKHAKRGFLMDIKKVLSENSVPPQAWIRKAPGGSNDWQDAQVDVTAIPGVRPLRKDGKWVNFR